MRHSYGFRRKKALSPHTFLVAVAVFTGLGLLMLTLRSMDPPQTDTGFVSKVKDEKSVARPPPALNDTVGAGIHGGEGRGKTCATVEEMGESFKGSEMVWKESMRVRNVIRQHFALNGASRIRELPPEQFCKHGFVLGKSSEAGFGNEMYKILNAGALSVMLNRSLIIGQTRRKFPFGDYISYSNHTFTLNEVKHLWRQNGCVQNYKRHLIIRIDDFVKAAKTNVLCSNWRKWEQPIIWFQNTTDALPCQFFLKNVHFAMRKSASDLFGEPELLHSRPNVFGELMKFLISPSEDVEEAVKWVLGGGADPDISLHMRMLMNRPVRAVHAALDCVKNAMHSLHHPRPKVVLVSDTPAFVKSTRPEISKFAEVLHFDYQKYQGNISGGDNKLHSLDFRVKDWGPAPRWVAFVDFFLASRAKRAVVTGAHRRVGTTYAQLIAALAAANSLGQSSREFAFLSTFQSNLLSDGLRLQVGWGHVWNRFAGPLSCPKQTNQCAYTPLLPPAWWDGIWQSPIPRDIRRLEVFGIKLSALGTIDERHLESFCSTKKNTVNTLLLV